MYFKIKLINNLKYLLFTLFDLWIIVLIMNKTFLLPYVTSLLEIYDYTLCEFYLRVYLFILLGQRILPFNFKKDFWNNNDEAL